MLEELRSGERLVGVKQILRALARGSVRVVFFAADADPALVAPLRELCSQKGVRLVSVPSMRQLGEACGIAVNASAAALV